MALSLTRHRGSGARSSVVPNSSDVTLEVCERTTWLSGVGLDVPAGTTLHLRPQSRCLNLCAGIGAVRFEPEDRENVKGHSELRNAAHTNRP